MSWMVAIFGAALLPFPKGRGHGHDALESSSRGLAAAKAASRLAALGPNELRAAKRPPVIK